MAAENGLDKSVRYLKGVGPKRAETLERLGIKTVRDLLFFLPRSYEDRSHIIPIADLKVGRRATIKAKVLDSSAFISHRGRRVWTVHVADNSGKLKLIWFQSGHLKEEDFPVGHEMYFTGKLDFYEKGKRLQMVSPQMEDAEAGGIEAIYTTRVLPEYPLTEGVSQGVLRKIVKRALDECMDVPKEFIPEALLQSSKLPPINRALMDAHFPPTVEKGREARRRFVYEDFLILELGMALRRRRIKHEPGIAFRITPQIEEHFRRLFPFSLTAAQERVIKEIASDMQKPEPMNRLLQGDVGSGKTAVAMYPLLVAVANKFQAAIMAPTEILAEQHFRRFNEFLRHGRVRMALLRGGANAAERREMLEGVSAGRIDLVVGTHALIEEDVEFRRLGAVVVDEQHKFGVLQRQKLRRKGVNPDVLVMTATPIPRTLALTVFGDLDVSALDEMPPGRHRIETRYAEPRDLKDAHKFLIERLRQGEQAYIVYPLVEESEKSDLGAATKMAEELQAGALREFRVGLVHGRMPGDKKERVMDAFRKREIAVLVATQVIEVGVDVPNATVMIIEHAERFGLAQLHQLRGRIGRGSGQSWCYLVGKPGSREARDRLRVLLRTTDGFRIAEEDLRLRGPGEFFGTRQHGLPELKIADIINDFALLRLARNDAFALVERDPKLEKPEHAALKQAVAQRFEGRMELIQIG